MKVQTIRITVNEDTILKIRERVREGSFHNKSHFFEYAAKKFLGDSDLNAYQKSSCYI